MRHPTARSRSFALAVASALVVPLLLTAPVMPSTLVPGADAAGPKPKPVVDSPTVRAKDKIHPKLQRAMDAAAPGETIRFAARIVPGTRLAPFAARSFARPFVDPLGLTVAIGSAQAGGLRKLAGLPGVISLQLQESIVEPPKPIDTKRPLPAQPKPALVTNGTSPGPAPTGWFHTGSQIHGSQDAWAKGYTGDGVRLMSNDSGADYCHPDLLGTWAYTDDGGPYDGLPQMFDSFSSVLAANDVYLGSTYIAQGLADYADTSTEVTFKVKDTSVRHARYRPIGAKVRHNFTLPSTSKSGVYHIGSHPDVTLSAAAEIINKGFKGGEKAVPFERAGILVVDEQTAGVYDTVYVDLNYDYDFRNDAPARLTRDMTNHEVACLDYDQDGLNDISGGLVYFIADGATPIPTLDWLWGFDGTEFGNGDLVAFHVADVFSPAGNHGQGTTSVATGQGIVVGSVISGPGGPPVAGGRGLVVGPGKDVRTTQNGDFYSSPFIEDAFLYATRGYDGQPASGDEVQIVSNSWAFSFVENDGLDLESRLIDLINQDNDTSTFLFAAGNGGPGFGTESAVSPASGMNIGAATLNDTHGAFYPDIEPSQINGGDVISFSNRGPTPQHTAGVDVTAIGAFGTSDIDLNEVLWGAVATALFSGTSMATPVASGNLALIYDAWRERTGSWPTFDQARAVLMASAHNQNNDVFSQGAGLVNADTGTDIAAGLGGVRTTPSDWSVGDYRGTEYEAFVHVLNRGDTDSQAFTIHDHRAAGAAVPVTLTADRFSQSGSTDYSFTTLDVSQSHAAFPIPDYVVRIDEDIPAGTDLVIVRMIQPYDQFDPAHDFDAPWNFFELDIEDWTDRNGDGDFWNDANGNGKVDIGETDRGENNGVSYDGAVGPTQQARMHDPLTRMTDGIFISLYHFGRSPDVPVSDLRLVVEYWDRTAWDWLTLDSASESVPAGGSAAFEATVAVPSDAAFGVYEGAIRVAAGDHVQTIPVTVAVAADGPDLTMGGTPPQDDVYDNGRLSGLTNALWRPETGDWRFFALDVADDLLSSDGSHFLVASTEWDNPGSDIDTIVLGPTEDCFSNAGLEGCPDPPIANPARYGPYALETVARSQDTNVGFTGYWRFQTSSGGAAELIAAPIRDGLHEVLLHHVIADLPATDEATIDEPFSGSVGLVSIDPGSITGGPADSPVNVTISTGIDLDGLAADGFGLSAPVTTRETVLQDDPDDPSTASFSTAVDIVHGAVLEVTTANSADESDIDLYVYGPDGEVVATSLTPTDDERVEIRFPLDGTYRIDVHGWQVVDGTDEFDLTINAVQGTDVTVTGLAPSIGAGGSDTFEIAWSAAGKPAGTYQGIVLLGPTAAPGLFRIPIEITVPAGP